jgi:hypothetical protein
MSQSKRTKMSDERRALLDKDLSGMKIGNFSVIEPVKPYTLKPLRYHVECVCGARSTKPKGELLCPKNGMGQCCIDINAAKNRVEAVGKQYGEFTLLSMDDKNNCELGCSCGAKYLRKLKLGALRTLTRCSACSEQGVKLEGLRFGKLVVISEGGRDLRNGQKEWNTLCDCGKIRVVKGQDLTGNYRAIRSCGECSQKEGKNLAGKVFGRLKITGLDKQTKSGCYWNVVCHCGLKKSARVMHIKKGAFSSCLCPDNSKRKSLRITNEYRAEYPHLADPGFCHVLSNYTRGSRIREIEMGLSAQEIFNLSQGHCFYCGEAPVEGAIASKLGNKFNGIDRKESSKGYTLENCVSCCSPCNRMKGKWNVTEFVLRLKSILAHVADPDAESADT